MRQALSHDDAATPWGWQSARRTLFVLAWVMALSSLVVCAARSAWGLPGVKPQRVVEVTCTPTEVQFANLAGPGMYDATMEMKVVVDSNCAISGLTLDASALVLEEPIDPPPPNTPPATIPTSRLFTKATGMADYVALTAPATVLGPRGPGHYEFTLKYRVQVLIDDAPGRYHGTCNVSVLPAP